MSARPPAASESIGERLRRLRLERGLSQRDVSSPGVSYAYVSRIEAGTRQPSVKALRKLAGKLGVSAGFLETGSHLADGEHRELRLADAELALRLGESVDVDETLADVLEEATAAGEEVTATRARVALGLAAAARGEPGEAARRLEQAIELGRLTPARRPDAFSALAAAYRDSGEPDRAADVLRRCNDDARALEPRDGALHLRFARELAELLASERGDAARARELVEEALAANERNRDPYAPARASRDLARRAAAEDDGHAALALYRRAGAFLELHDRERAERQAREALARLGGEGHAPAG